MISFAIKALKSRYGDRELKLRTAGISFKSLRYAGHQRYEFRCCVAWRK